MKWKVLLLLMLALSGCSLAPNYQRPAMKVPSYYKENKGTGKWLPAKPSCAALDSGSWWTLYEDPTLNALEDQVLTANQNLKAALARYEQARAVLAVQRSAYYPSLLGVFNGYREHSSSNISNTLSPPTFNDVLLSANITYEVDLWGRVRNSVATAKSLAKASAADLAAINLSLHAELASDYFALRGDDAAQRVLDETVVVYEKALYLVRQRYKGGAAPIEDVDQAQTQVNSARTLAADMHLKRAQLEHAIAVLIGENPSTFSLKAISLKSKTVAILPDLPSTLLERRPDIAEAELKVQAANSNIGVARAAFFPAFNLSTAIGYESAALSTLLKGPSLVWSLGPTAASALLNNGSMPLLTQTIFDGGKLIALSQQASAKYFETVANYRQTVLTAYQEVENSLVAVRQLEQENKTQTLAATAANRAVNQAMYRYKGGLTTYLEVVVVKNIALQSELSAVDIHTRRQLASVQLIKALGGGYSFESSLQSDI